MNQPYNPNQQPPGHQQQYAPQQQQYNQAQGQGFGFNVNDYEPQKAFDNLPNGWYNIQITEAEMKALQSGNGTALANQYTVYGGPFHDRKLFDNLNIIHNNEETQEIARRSLRAIQDALLKPVNGPMDILQAYMCVKVGLDKPKKDASDAEKAAFEPRNTIRGYKPFDQALHAQNSQAPQQGAPAYNVQVTPVGNAAPQYNPQQPPQSQQPQYGQQPQYNAQAPQQQAPQQYNQQPPVQQAPPQNYAPQQQPNQAVPQQQYSQPAPNQAPPQQQSPQANGPQTYDNNSGLPVNQQGTPPAHQNYAPGATAPGGQPSQDMAGQPAPNQAAPQQTFAPQQNGQPPQANVPPPQQTPNGNAPPPGQNAQPPQQQNQQPPQQQAPNQPQQAAPNQNYAPPAGNQPPPGTPPAPGAAW